MRMDTTTYIMLFSMVEKAITGSSPMIQRRWYVGFEMPFKAMYSTTKSNVRRYSVFQVCGAAIDNAPRASSVGLLGTHSSEASDDRRGRKATALWIRWPRYAGVGDEGTLNVSDAVYEAIRCLTGSQWSDRRSDLASVRPPR